MQINLSGWVTTRYQVVKMVLCGDSCTDKLKLLIVAILFIIPRRFLYHNDTLLNLVSMLLRKTVIKILNHKWVLNHPSQFVMIHNDYEKQISGWFAVHGDTFIDIGANIGRYSILAHSNFNHVYSLEPAKDTYTVLCDNILLNNIKNILPMRVAAWNKRETVDMMLKLAPGLNSLVRNGIIAATEQVECWPLDEMDINWGKIDLVKIDVEGAEYQVIQGMTRLLAEHKPTLIIEIWPENANRVFQLLDNIKYHVVSRFESNYLLKLDVIE